MDPNAPNVTDPSFPPPSVQHPQELPHFDISDEDIITAISSIPSSSASGPDGVPAILLKNCAKELCRPIKMIWEESFTSGVVPKFYKETNITPLFKKGDRAKAVNYRPVALTSLVIKIYERVLRKNMVDFIEKNQLLCDNQHGFRSGRSCLTQLLSHVDDIVQGLVKNADTDAIYLDFAKAFDKVDHRLLLLKMERMGFHRSLVKLAGTRSLRPGFSEPASLRTLPLSLLSFVLPFPLSSLSTLLPSFPPLLLSLILFVYTPPIHLSFSSPEGIKIS